MKKLLTVSSIFFSLNSFAYSFNMDLNCEVVYGARGSCQVVNQLPSPIQCRVSANGQTQSGYWVNLFGQGIVYPGSSAWVTVNANNPYIDPLINVEAQASCFTL